LSKIIAMATAVPMHKHKQTDIQLFMESAVQPSQDDARKMRFLYKNSGIENRYSVIGDFSNPSSNWHFFGKRTNGAKMPSLEKRMELYKKHAPQLGAEAIQKCIHNIITTSQITHLITVSCTGMSAPGIDLDLMELLQLNKNIYRTSVNFMGCYAAIHALKMADAICNSTPNANVLIVCVELCTIHFQPSDNKDNVAASLLFADGAAAVLVTPNSNINKGLFLKYFYAEVFSQGKKDMAWELSSTGFLMTLSGFIPQLIEADFENLFLNATQQLGLRKNEVSHWCMHPGGKKILDAIAKSLQLNQDALKYSYEVLKQFGNMSSPTILFVLQQIFIELIEQDKNKAGNAQIFAAAFGPGLTMETFIASTHA
jgi:predicted naringenin-chalcone synthase